MMDDSRRAEAANLTFASRDCVKLLDQDGRIVSINEDGLRLLEVTDRGAVERQLWADLWPEDTQGVVRRAVEGARETGIATFTAMCPTAAGTEKWWDVTVVAVPQEEGRFCAISRDITERRQRDARRDTDEEMARMALMGSGNVGLWDWIVESDLLHGDANFARLYGLDVAQTAAGLTEEQYQEFVVPEDLEDLRADIRSVFERGEEFHVEYRIAVPGEPLRWVECRGRMIHGGDGTPYRFSGTAVDITSRKASEEQRQLLMQELSHRVKNSFAMIQAIAAQSLRGAEPEAVNSFEARLAALAGTHDVLLQTSWNPSTMRQIAAKVLRIEAEGDRFVLEGDDVAIGPQTSLSLTLLLHELATNALKYGALSAPEGKVTVAWEKDGEMLRLSWTETGGPPPAQPAGRGFGSRLIGMGLAGSRKSELDYAPEGLRARFEARLDEIAN